MNESKKKTCQNCQIEFTIEPDDFAFYEKIKVPAPTFCSECRFQRKFLWRNHRSLYRRKCNAPNHKEEMISVFHPVAPFRVYCQGFWWSDGWDPVEYALEYDFSRPFFSQFRSLLERVPMVSLSNINSPGSDYCNFSHDSKNCYLSFAVGDDENVLYSERIQQCKDCADMYVGIKNELCYECINCNESYQLRHSVNSNNCVDSMFLRNCRNCTNCIGCSNLVSKSNCLFNVQCSKEEYEKKVSELDLSSRAGIEAVEKKFFEEIYGNSIHRFATTMNSVGVTGNNIKNSKNSKYCFDIFSEAEDCKFIQGSLQIKDTYDGIGQYKHNFCYENVDNDIGERNIATATVYSSTNAQYSFNCHSCSDIFGCVGLRNKQYCILNKQYTKEEYKTLIPRIIEHMNTMPYVDRASRVYVYGEFFPGEIGLFAYNETLAQDYFPLTKEETIERKYAWRDQGAKQYAVTIPNDKIPQRIIEVYDDITKEIIECAHKGSCVHQCTQAFKIIPEELAFYRKMNLPLPRLCPNCRHYQRLKQRNPLKLWHRQCQCGGEKSDNSIYTNTIKHQHNQNHCPNEFETSYSPERKEIVYCEQCYNAEVV